MGDAAGDIGERTNGDILFHVDIVGLSGPAGKTRYNCYLRVPKTRYNHLLFRVTTPATGPWPAKAATPEGDQYPEAQDKAGLRAVIGLILTRDRTREIVLYLRGTVPQVGV